MNNFFRSSDLIPGILAAVIVLASYFVVDLGLPIAVVLGIVTYFAARWAMPSPPDTSGDEAFALAQYHLGKFGAVSGRLKDRRVYQMAQSIRDDVNRIAGLARSQPKHAAVANDVVTLYLESAIQLVTRYQRLEALSVPGAEEAMQEVREILPRIDRRLDQVWEEMHRDDVVELHAETEKLKFFLNDGGSARSAEVEEAMAAAERAAAEEIAAGERELAAARDLLSEAPSVTELPPSQSQEGTARE